MIKIMQFIDGSWLYKAISLLAASYDTPGLKINYGLLPGVLGRVAGNQLGVPDVDIVRVHLYASLPDNFDPIDQELVDKQRDFFDRLKEDFYYEVELFPIDFRGHRIRYEDRVPESDFLPREKCVDVALATSLLYYATIPDAYDLAVVVIGDRDYIPVLQHVRRLGKRIAIASIRGSCASEYSDYQDVARVKDTDIIWLDDLVPEIELKFERHQVKCQSSLHEGDRWFWTAYHPRKGEQVFCDECRRKWAQLHEAGSAQSLTHGSADVPSNDDSIPTPAQEDTVTAVPPGAQTADQQLAGIVERMGEQGYGFIRGADGLPYFFHRNDLVDEMWDALEIGERVCFDVEATPDEKQADKARCVRCAGENTNV